MVIGVLFVCCSVSKAFKVYKLSERTLYALKKSRLEGQVIEIKSMSGNPVCGIVVDSEGAITPEASSLTASSLLNELYPKSRIVLQHAPALFTGLGILFTFFGLISGLSELELAQDSVAANESMQGLIAGVGVAFGSSLAGLAISMLSLMFSRYAMGKLEQSVSRLKREVQRSQREMAPSKMLAEMNASLFHIKNLNDRLIDQAEAQTAKIGALASDLGDVLQNALTAPLQSIEASLSGIAQGSVDAHMSALEGVMENFMEGFNERLGDRFDRLGEVLDDTLNWHERTHEAFDRVAERLDSAAELQDNVFAKQVELIEAQVVTDERRHVAMRESNAMQERTNELVRTSVADVHRFAMALQDSEKRWEEMCRTLGEGMEVLQDSLETLGEERDQFAHIVDTLKMGTAVWKEELELTASRYEQLSADLRQGLHAGLAETFGVFDKETSQIVDHLNGSALRIEDSYSVLSQTLTMLESLMARFEALPSTRTNGTVTNARPNTQQV